MGLITFYKTVEYLQKSKTSLISLVIMMLFLGNCLSHLLTSFIIRFDLTTLSNKHIISFSMRFNSSSLIFSSNLDAGSNVWCICLSGRLVYHKFFLTDNLVIWKLNQSAENLTHLIWQQFNFVIVMKYFKLLWSVNIFIDFWADWSSALYYLKLVIIINSSLTYTS